MNIVLKKTNYNTKKKLHKMKQNIKGSTPAPVLFFKCN